MSKEENNNVVFVLMVVFGLFFLVVLVNYFFPQVSVDCELEYLQYARLPVGTSCWLSDVSPEMCPLPGTVRCKYEGRVSQDVLARFGLS